MARVYAWGGNGFGEFGNNTTTSSSSPVSVNKFVNIASGGETSYFIDSTGGVWSCGYNQNGQLGINNTVSQSTAVQIARPGSYQAIAKIVTSTGQHHFMALDENGHAWSWGRNYYLALGDGGSNDQSSPVSVLGSNVFTQLSVAEWSSFAVDNAGVPWAWGLNSSGQLGLGDVSNRNSPVQMIVPGSFIAISGGQAHCLLLDHTGMIWAVGNGASGKIGNGDVANFSSPVTIARPGSYVAIAAGCHSSYAIDHTGTLWAWGLNTAGELGLGDLDNRSSPVSVLIAGSVSRISGGSQYALAVSSGIAYGWGVNTAGQLGSGDGVNRSSPVSVMSTKKYVNVAAGMVHSLGLLTSSNSYFSSSTVTDGNSATSTVDADNMVTTLQAYTTDTYFDSTSEINRVNVYYTHEDGRQQRMIIHSGNNLNGNVSWAAGAKDGTWQKSLIRVFDGNGAFRDVPRSAIGTAEDITHSGGVMNLNT